MEPLKVAIIGCGKPWRSEGATGTGISHEHAKAYNSLPETKLTALADIVRENAEAFQALHGGERIYTDYREMLAVERPDLVSICTWPGLHEEMVLACAEAGIRAVHCEKPMAPTLAASRRMVQACAQSGTQLTFNHQRRFDPPYARLKSLFGEEARLGKLLRIEMQCSNLFDWATHWFDQMFWLNHEVDAVWVLSQSEPTGGPAYFGVRMEGDGITRVKFANDLNVVLLTGDETNWGAMIRAWGEKGVAEVSAVGWDTLRIWEQGSPEWVLDEMEDLKAQPHGMAGAIRDLARCLLEGGEPETSARKALRATELIFASYLSAETGRKVELPLTVDDVGLRAWAADGVELNA